MIRHRDKFSDSQARSAFWSAALCAAFPSGAPQLQNRIRTHASAHTAVYLLLAIAVALNPGAYSQDSSDDSSAATNIIVTARLTPPVTPFHRPAELLVTVVLPEGKAVTFPDIPGKLGDITVSSHSPEETQLTEGIRRIEKRWTLDAMASGERTLPLLTVKVGEEETHTLPVLRFEARELTEAELAAVDRFAAATPPSAVLERQTNPWLVTGAIAAVVAAIVIGAYLYMKRRRTVEPEAIRPPWEVALTRLAELEQRQLPQQGRYEPFYVDLSAILRYYIEDRFHLRAPEQTTQEFLEAAAKSGQLTNEQQEVLGALLKHSDRVKFARYEPSQDDMGRSFAAVRWFVEETTPHIEPAEAKEAA